MSATKGPSNLYGNPAGIPTEHINYPYAVTFNQRTLMKHYNDHGDEVGATSAQEYQELAIDFANDVNNVTHDSFVDQNAFCAAQWPPVRLPVATRRWQWPGLISHFPFNHNDIVFRHPLEQRV
jgi:hypothetical protein